MNKKKRHIAFKKLLKILNKKERSICLTLNDAIYFRSWRTEAIDQSSFYTTKLFFEISKRLRLNCSQDVLYLYPDEVVNGLKKKINIKELKEIIRKRRFAFGHIRIGKKEYKIDGRDAFWLLKRLNIEDANKKALAGRSAFRGRARGRVVLVTKKSDYSNIVKADILVATSTMPDMVPYMQKIKGIVTEEGGVLSHASVVSRELKIPAVIGVAGVTKLFKDGDLVEVDAENGLIKKL